MDNRPRPGAICFRKSDPGTSLLLVELNGSRSVAVRRHQQPEFFQVDAAELTATGEDPAPLKVLQLRWRTQQASLKVAPGKPIRTAMVLCAGLGTRLRPLTNVYPKPALPFFSGPLIRYSFALLKGAGVERVVINTHHLPKVMEETAAREARSLGLELRVSHEPVIQGTGGGVRDARQLLGDEPFILLNGDAFMSLDLRVLLGAHQSRGDAATMAAVPMPPDEKFAAVEATPEGDVKRIGKTGEDAPGVQPWHFVGAHVIEPAIFDFIPPKDEQDINRTVYLAMIRAGLKVRVCPVALGAWADLGTPGRYLTACAEVLTGLCDLEPLGDAGPIARDELRQLLLGQRRRFWAHPSATVEQSPEEGWAVVCEGAEVRDTLLRRIAVLPGTRLAGEKLLQDAIVSGELRLRAQ
ncbi:MAG TPA: nucleotidyltransferase family protein [Myxococcales bacterium]|jgi:mannose-1-phosphate guanylyltransferase